MTRLVDAGQTAVVLRRRVRAWLVVFIIGLVVSGLTAFPLETEVRVGLDVLRAWRAEQWAPGLVEWFARVEEGLTVTNDAYPFLAYGTDWLAFAHLVIAVAFWGPLRDPVRNVWVVDFGLIACAGVIPLALICAPIREIPWGWTLIDMSFGVFGAIPLLLVRRMIGRLAVLETPGPA
ncbi:hypothetical protein [Myceligenerans xiligouense]|uniref:Cytoplasmic membrane protein n=1 Tax=Myceligenerans xiligouense TaxID=253184 RepID=A0A3N4Z7Q3_9MICO|nr:hypothetical protein [Myceligenerans xiligouense]RPF21362.1 hypothetical protein EDD34_1989 [Myceligenerans xiligouense]